MALNGFERSLISELSGLIGTKIREKELLEWRLREIEPREGERVFHLPDLGAWVAIPDTVKIKKPQ